MAFDQIRTIVEHCLAPGCFFVAKTHRLRVESEVTEELPWELLLGHLLDRSTTSTTQRFTSWHVYLDEAESLAPVPLLSIHWQADHGQLHVARQILTHGYEAYEDAPGVILTRPRQKWTTELVGSQTPSHDTPERSARELGSLLLAAVVGTSRLPITSVESPLPAYSLGQLAYLPGLSRAAEPLLDAGLFLELALGSQRAEFEQAKAIEVALRVSPTVNVARLCHALHQHAGGVDASARLIRTVFNTAALAPYTHFSDALVRLVETLADREWFGIRAAQSLLSYMLRQLCRHLTAFDLTLFHNFGANYPDALLLDTLLKALLELLDRSPQDGLGPEGRLLRRGLRQACVTRKQYEGHRVPDAPTSMGENTRVLPEPFVRVPEEQIYEAGKRNRRLFDQQPTETLFNAHTLPVFHASLEDLDDPRELRELGAALYLDRPLGVLKSPGEVDRTPLLAYEAFSRFVAARRIAILKSAGWIDRDRQGQLRDGLVTATPAGLSASEIEASERPGVVSIADANKAATDFVFMRTTHSSLRHLLGQYDWHSLGQRFSGLLRWLSEAQGVLLVQHVPRESPRQAVLRAYCGSQLRLELGFPVERTTMALYQAGSGIELVRRLQLLRAWDADQDSLVDLHNESWWIELLPERERP